MIVLQEGTGWFDTVMCLEEMGVVKV